ncbi:hypothetical protein MMC12_002199 [Toensbergia leucococca]|nr:hypothetical protein [Toensbergia leucococca]
MFFLSKPVLFISSLFLALNAAAAPLAFTNDFNAEIPIGQRLTLSWTGDSTPVKLILLTGYDPKALQPTEVIGMTQKSSFVWTPSRNHIPGPYAIEIDQHGDINYSPPFQLTAPSMPY